LLGIVPEEGGMVDFSMVRSFGNLATCGRVCEGAAPGHNDGWGVVAWVSGKPRYLGREPTSASKDSQFEEACKKGESLNVNSHLIAHLRKASVAAKVRENTHPFVLDEWAFAHNGTIRRLNLRYTTDSQWFFESIIKEVKKNGGDVVAAVSKNVRIIHEIYPYSSLTFLMSNGSEFYAFRDAAKNLDYYTMYFVNFAGALVLSQEKFFDAQWQSLDNGSLLIHRADSTTEILHMLPELDIKQVYAQPSPV
jgi:predicted glutamine amidotransferase